VRVDDRGAEDAPSVHDGLHEVRAAVPSQIARSFVREPGAETRHGIPALRSSSESPTRAISGSVYVIHGVLEASHFASATGGERVPRTIPAWYPGPVGKRYGPATSPIAHDRSDVRPAFRVRHDAFSENATPAASRPEPLDVRAAAGGDEDASPRRRKPFVRALLHGHTCARAHGDGRGRGAVVVTTPSSRRPPRERPKRRRPPSGQTRAVDDTIVTRSRGAGTLGQARRPIGPRHHEKALRQRAEVEHALRS